MADMFFEFIFELIFEGAFEISRDRSFSKWIRYPCIVLLGLLFTSVIALLLWVAYIAIEEHILISLLMVIIDALLIVGVVVKFKRIYLQKRNNTGSK